MAIASNPDCLDKGGAMATPIISNDCLGLGTYSNQQRRNYHYSNQRSPLAWPTANRISAEAEAKGLRFANASGA
ncbi:hypothetical protein [Moorena sp. SIO3H5]|uniref:hypothetical protein n=1 Tax=Moorena sp. SIO3H5 TaxID=2607834 RepID=UPI0013BA20AC|nr:hypothetical protein [Moorena sp. SIO3H5]NEO69314.1 hypothetical protein [Moorena sp. SIO3H5]